MIISVIGMLIGALVAGVGVYYLMKEKQQDKESVKFTELSVESAALYSLECWSS